MNRRTFLKATAATIILPSLYVRGETPKLQWRKWSEEKPDFMDYCLFYMPDTSWLNNSVFNWGEMGNSTNKNKTNMTEISLSSSYQLAFEEFLPPRRYGTYDLEWSEDDTGNGIPFTILDPIISEKILEVYWLKVDEILYNKGWVLHQKQEPPVGKYVILKRKFADDPLLIRQQLFAVKREDPQQVFKGSFTERFLHLDAYTYPVSEVEGELYNFYYNYIRGNKPRIILCYKKCENTWGWASWIPLPEIPKM